MIVDEALDFFGAGTSTSSLGQSTIMVHCARELSSLSKIREEYDAFVTKQPVTENSLKSNEDLMDSIIDIEGV